MIGELNFITMNKKYLFLAITLTILTFIGCTKTYKVKLENLTPEQKTKLTETVKTYGDKIKNFTPLKLKEGEKMPEEYSDLNKPPVDWFLEKSKAERRLGEIDEAISTLKKSLDYYEASSVSWLNLGAIYSDVGECDNAEKYYIKPFESFGQAGIEYIQYAARCYLNQGNKNKVQELTDLYKKDGGTNVDPEIKDYLENKTTTK